MAERVFTWDWKEQASLTEILSAAREMSASGPWFFAEPDTGGDYYACIISDRELTPEDAEHLLFPEG